MDSVAQKKKALRGYMPKVRTGCLTCRIRRVKCDEKRPACHKCTSTGRACDGYSNNPNYAHPRKPTKVTFSSCESESSHGSASPITPTTPSSTASITNTTERENAVIPAATPRSITIGSLYPPAIEVILQKVAGMELSDPQDRRSFDFFYKQTMPWAGLYFVDDLYTNIALQITTPEPALMHTFLALSSLHESFVTKGHIVDPRKYPKAEVFAKRHYNKAVNILRTRLSTKDQQVEITLICCMMFIWLETISGNYSGALKHAASGMELLRYFKDPQNRTSGSRGVLKSNWQLVDTFMWQTFSGPLTDTNTQTEPVFDGTIPPAFNSIRQARTYLNHLYIEVLIHMKGSCRDGFSPNEAAYTSKQRLNALLRLWEDAFRDYRDRQVPSPVQTFTDIGINHLDLHYETLTVMLAVSLSYPTMALDIDNPLPEVSRLPKATTTMNSSQLGTFLTSGRQHHPLTSYSHDMGAVIPLYAIAIRCQNPVAKSKAVELLGMKPVRHSIWGRDMDGVGDAPWAKHMHPSLILPTRFVSTLKHLGEKSWPPVEETYRLKPCHENNRSE